MDNDIQTLDSDYVENDTISNLNNTDETEINTTTPSSMSDITNNLISYIQTIDKRSAYLDQKESELSQRESKLQSEEDKWKLKLEILRKEKEDLESEMLLMKDKISGYDGNSDRILINAGGNLINTTRRTMCRYENTILSNMFNGNNDDILLGDDGIYYLDVDPDTFEEIVKFLRHPKIVVPSGGSLYSAMLDDFGIVNCHEYVSIEEMSVRNLNRFITNMRFAEDNLTYIGERVYSSGVVTWTILLSSIEGLFVGVKLDKDTRAFGWLYENNINGHLDVIEVSEESNFITTEHKISKQYIITLQLDCDSGQLILIDNSLIRMQIIPKDKNATLLCNICKDDVPHLVRFYHVLPATRKSRNVNRTEAKVHKYSYDLKVLDI